MRRTLIPASLASLAFWMLCGAFAGLLVLVNKAASVVEVLTSDTLRIPAAVMGAMVLLALALLGYSIRASAGNRLHGFWLPLSANGLAMMLAFLTGEIAVRQLATPTV